MSVEIDRLLKDPDINTKRLRYRGQYLGIKGKTSLPCSTQVWKFPRGWWSSHTPFLSARYGQLPDHSWNWTRLCCLLKHFRPLNKFRYLKSNRILNTPWIFPPITTTFLGHPANRRSSLRARAMLVKGPIHAKVISHGCSANILVRTKAACSPSLCAFQSSGETWGNSSGLSPNPSWPKKVFSLFSRSKCPIKGVSAPL